MVLKINPSRMPVWSKPDELLFGSGPSRRVISNLTDGQQRLVQLLCRGIPNDFLQFAAQEYEVPDAEEFIQRIRPTLLDSEIGVGVLDRQFVEQNFAELCRAQAQFAMDGSFVVAQRKQASIFVDSSPRASGFVQALFDSGVGEVLQETKGRFDNKRLSKIDVAITIDQSTFRPVTFRRWQALGVPQVAVLFDQDGVWVSPVMDSGMTACLQCLVQQDPEENAVEIRSQLLFSKQRFDDAVSRNFAIAIATQLALRRIDATGGFALSEFESSGYRLNSDKGTVHQVDWQFSESCPCRQAG